MSFETPRARLLTSDKDPHFWDALELYVESFPRDEREPLSQIAKVASTDTRTSLGSGQILWRAGIAEVGESLAGFSYFGSDSVSGLGFHVFLVVSEKFRRHGIGRKLVEFVRAQVRSDLESSGSSLRREFFECERPELVEGVEREIRERRLEFFGKLGGSVVSRTYVQPALSDDRHAVPLLLMAYPSESAGTDRIEDQIRDFHRRFWGLAQASPEERSTLEGLVSEHA